MKILFMMPPTDLARSYGGLKEFSNPSPSIGLAYIASLLRENQYDVSILDAYVNKFSIDETVAEIVKVKPDVLGVSVLTTSAHITEEIVTQIRNLLPGILIVMGNLHASMFAEELLTKKHADIIVHQEGEYTMLEVVNAIKNKTSLEPIKGISYLKNGVVQHNELRPFIEDIDALPFPAWDLYDLSKYHNDPRTSVKNRKIRSAEMQILATRGCPYTCTFCSSRTSKSLGNKYRMRQPVKVVDEIELHYNKYGVSVFSFTDLAFPLVKAHATAVCEELIKRGLNKKISWLCEPRVKPIDKELLGMLKKAGCARVCFGIESGNQEILDALRKQFTLDDVRKAVAAAKSEGLEVDGMFMLGLPGETYEMSRKTINFAKKLGVRFAMFNLFVPYPGCELYDVLKNDSKLTSDGWSGFTSYPSYTSNKPVFIPDGRDWEELVQTQKQAMKEFYLTRSFIIGEIKRFQLRNFRAYWSGLKSLAFPAKKI
jgi:anaerobic magnesium-protoporphyrin IX monomethyl ester cyclase